MARSSPCFQANVDEIFVDICRQMLRRDDAMQAVADAEDNEKSGNGLSGYRRRRRTRKKDGQTCIIL